MPRYNVQLIDITHGYMK